VSGRKKGGALLVSVDGNGALVWWNVDSAQQIGGKDRFHDGPPDITAREYVLFAPGTQFIPGTRHGSLTTVLPGNPSAGIQPTISLQTAQGFFRLRGHRAPITCAAVSPDGKTAVTGGQDEKVIFWDVPSAISRTREEFQIEHERRRRREAEKAAREDREERNDK
jgi:WD40 repeat protein